jgi:outer membrane protein OmpA-like peptidoglycan-associated protein
MHMSNLIKWAFFIPLVIVYNIVAAQTESKELNPGYYVVVGAYAPAKVENAKRFATTLAQRSDNADYGFNSSRNLYYVYINYFTTLKAAIEKMESVRKSHKFVDAWVRVVPGDIKMDTPIAQTKEQPATDQAKQASSEPKIDSITVASDSSIVDGYADVTDNEPIKQYAQMTLGNTEVFLSLYNAAHNRIVDGDVQVVDAERSRPMAKVKGNEYLNLPDPKSKSQKLILICDAFGYRKVQCDINYSLPLADTVKSNIDLWGTTLVVSFDLVRYKLGDVAVLNNVTFYNDASIMMPESKTELTSLLQMMLENKNYRIALHGHTNGNYHGKIINRGPSNDFFSLTGSSQSVGSAKDLSENRAEIIKDYLVANGIDATRIEVKGWGGKKPLYDSKSVNAGKNVRVEVELLAE